MHPRSATVLVIGLILLAGCVGFQWGPNPPTPTTSSNPTGDTNQYPPGITSTGVSDSFTLASAHGETLQGQSYTVTTTYLIEYPNGTLYTSETVTTHITAGEERYLYNSTVRGTIPRIYGSSSGTLVYYSNGSVVVRKLTIGTETSYEVVTGSNGEPVPPTELSLGRSTENDRIGILFGALSNASVTRQSESVYRVESTSLARNSLEIDGIPITNVSDVRFTATITRHGLVREYTLSYEGRVDGHAVSIREQREYSAIGTTTVEQPPWYDKVVSNSTE